MKEYHFAVSDDMKHDPHWVKAAVDAIIASVKQQLKQCGEPDLHIVRVWSDGCSSQFKSKDAFLSMFLSSNHHGLTVVHNFKASGHGKGEVDGAATVLKNQTTKATMQTPPVDIKNAKDWYDYLVATLSDPKDSPFMSRSVWCFIQHTVWF